MLSRKASPHRRILSLFLYLLIEWWLWSNVTARTLPLPGEFDNPGSADCGLRIDTTFLVLTDLVVVAWIEVIKSAIRNPQSHSPVSSCHHPWTAELKLIISCGHIFVQIYHAASSICSISSAICSLSSLRGHPLMRWHGRCFTLSRWKTNKVFTPN